ARRRGGGWAGSVETAAAADDGDPREDESANGDERRDASRQGHGWQPPRRANRTPLSSQMDLVDGRIDDAIRELLGAVGQPGHGDPVEDELGGHATRSRAGARAALGA